MNRRRVTLLIDSVHARLDIVVRQIAEHGARFQSFSSRLHEIEQRLTQLEHPDEQEQNK